MNLVGCVFAPDQDRREGNVRAVFSESANRVRLRRVTCREGSKGRLLLGQGKRLAWGNIAGN